MPVRLVEWQLPYSWGEGIQIDENKVISLNLRDENNLIIYDAQDDEIYVDLQLPDGIKPTDAFPVGVTTGRVLVADGWDKAGTIISAKTTSWDVIKLLYADDWTLWIDNGTWIFKQLYFKADVDLIISAIQTQIDALSGLGKFLSLWDWETWLPISFPLSTPYEYHTWDWYMINVVDNTTNYRPSWTEFDGTASSTVETEATEIGDVYIYDWTTFLLQKNWWGWGSAVLFSQVLGSPYDNTNLATALNAKQDELTAGTNIQISAQNVISATWGSDIVYATQAEYTALLPWAESDGKHYFIYSTSGWGWWQPWVNTLAYFPLNSVSEETDQIWTWTYSSWGKPTFWTYTSANVDCASFDSSTGMQYTWSMPMTGIFTFSFWAYSTWTSWDDWKAIDMVNSNDGGTRINICYYSWRYQYYIWSYGMDSSGVLVVPNNSWHYITAIADGTTMYFYVDWLLSHSINYSYSSTTLNGFNIWNQIWNGLSRHWKWYLSEIIIENKVRTLQEISDYYDQTKWDYWIS